MTLPWYGFSGTAVGVGEPCMPVTIHALPMCSNIHVHTCALKAVLHTMHGDQAAVAWVAYVKPFVGSAHSKEAAVQSKIAVICNEYVDVFEYPDLPVHHDMDHHINLHDKTAKTPRSHK